VLTIPSYFQFQFGPRIEPAEGHTSMIVQVGVAVSVTLVAGLFQLVMRVFGLGIICSFMSMPFIVAFFTASATLGIVLQVMDVNFAPENINRTLSVYFVSYRANSSMGGIQAYRHRRC